MVLADALGDAQGLAAAGGSTTVVSMDGLAAFSVGDRYAVGIELMMKRIRMRKGTMPMVFASMVH